MSVKIYNLKKHYFSKYASYKNYKSQIRSMNAIERFFCITKTFTKGYRQNTVCASYVVSFTNAQKLQFSDGDFVEVCVSEVVNILCPYEEKIDVNSISLLYIRLSNQITLMRS